MNASGSGSTLPNVAMPVGLAVLSYVGCALPPRTSGSEIGSVAAISKVLSMIANIVLAAFTTPGVKGGERAKTDLGGRSAGISTLSRALGALLSGVALRQLWNARKLIR